MKYKNPTLIFVRKAGQAQSNMSLQLFQSLGHKNAFMFVGIVFILALTLFAALKPIFREKIHLKL